MSEDTHTLPQSQPLLWLLALLVGALAGWVALRSVRQAQHTRSRAAAAGHVAAGTLALGSGLWAAMVIGITAQAWAFPIGYRLDAVAAGWSLALLLCLLPVAWLSWRRSLLAMLVGGLLLAAAATAVQSLVLWSLGLLPGLQWRTPALAMAPLIIALGSAAGFGISITGPGHAGRWRKLWRLLAGAVIGLALVLGQDELMEAVRISAQIGSAHREDLPALMLSAAATVLVLPLLGLLALDQHWRRHQPAGAAASGLLSLLGDAARGRRSGARRRSRGSGRL